MKKGENMKKFFCVLCGICLFYMGYAQEKEVKAVIETNLGNMIVKRSLSMRKSNRSIITKKEH